MSNKPRVAIIGDFPIGRIYSPYTEILSGGARWLYTLYELLSTVEEYEFHWIVINKSINKEETVIKGNQYFHLTHGSGLTVGLYTGYFYNRWKAAKIIKRIAPDIVHAWGTERFYGLIAKDFKGHSLLSIQGILTAIKQRAQLSPFEKKQALYEGATIKNVEYISTESEWAQERIKEIAPDSNVMLWDYAIESDFFNTARTPSSSPCCLLAGTNTPVKNVQLAVSAFSRPELQHVTLYLAGVPANAHTKWPANIKPLGYVSREEIRRLLSETWLLVHPSLADSCPNIVKEARVMGVPAVVTIDCGAKQYIENGLSGFVIPSNDENALINSILHATKSIEVSMKMGSYNQMECRNALSQKNMLGKILEIYKLITAS